MEQLKEEIYIHWNKASCGTEHTKKEKFTADYFKQIENHRYTIEPEIFRLWQRSGFFLMINKEQ